MDFKNRDSIMSRWSFATFALSLSIVFVLLCKGKTIPHQAIWLIPQMTPNWLIWPITNALFVLTLVWMKTNRFTLNPFWRESRGKSYFLAFLQAILVSSFCEAYNLVTLIIASLIMWALIAYYFNDDLDVFYTSVCKHLGLGACEDPPDYSIGFFFLHFHTLISVYYWNLKGLHSAMDAVWIFILYPAIYLVVSIIIILIITLIIITIYYLAQFVQKTSKAVGSFMGGIIIGIVAGVFWFWSFLQDVYTWIKKDLGETMDWLWPARSD